MATFMIEGEWSGYRSSQEHVVHREFLNDRSGDRRSLIEWCDENYGIGYDDGTTLRLVVTELKPRAKRDKVVNGYTKLIRDCHRHNVTSVTDLPREKTLSKFPIGS